MLFDLPVKIMSFVPVASAVKVYLLFIHRQ